MKKEIKKSIVFAVLFIAISFGLNLFYSKLVMKQSILSRTDRQFDQFDKEIEHLIIGDSHSQYGLNPGVLGKSFNFSSSSGSYVHTYYKLKYILERTDKHVENVLMPLDAHSFSSWYFREPSNSWYWVKYMDFLEVGHLRKKVLLYFALEVQAYLASYIGKRDSFLRFMGKRPEERQMIDGYIPLDREFDDIETLNDKAKEIVAHHFAGKRIYDESILYYFWKILELCDKNSIPVILSGL